MPPTLAKVQAGQPLEIPASTYNAFVDVARAYRGNGVSFLRGRAIGGKFSQDVVLARNTSGALVPAFGVLAISGPIFPPSIAPDAFKFALAIEGVSPVVSTYRGRFGVALDPIPNNGFGRVCVSGVTVAKVSFPADDTRERLFADIGEAETDNLVAGDRGAARILWREAAPSGGVKWAIVRLEGLERTEIVAVVTGYTPAGTFRWSYAWEEIEFLDDGSYTKTGVDSSDHGVAYNPMELNNAASGHQTTGHEITVDDALEPQPIGIGGVEVPVVLARMDTAAGEIWIIDRLLGAPNAFDGACNVVAAAINLGDVIEQLNLAGLGVDSFGRLATDSKGHVVRTSNMAVAEAVLYDAWAVDSCGRVAVDSRANVVCVGDGGDGPTAPFMALSRAVGVDAFGKVVVDGRAAVAGVNVE